MKKAKKSLSQNFIKDKNICEKIVKNINIKNKNIVEIGPGYGFLTDFILLRRPAKLYLIEKDNNLFEFLKNKYLKKTNIEIINKDVLNVNFNTFNKFNVISNLPYNLSSKIILELFNHSQNISEMILMVQKEMGIKFNYNIDKLNKYKFYTKLFCDFKKCFDVSPNVFVPKPKVYSSVIKFNFKNKKIDYEKAKKFANIFFKNKRKKISNNLKIKKIIDKNISDKRIEQLNWNELLRIYNSF